VSAVVVLARGSRHDSAPRIRRLGDHRPLRGSRPVCAPPALPRMGRDYRPGRPPVPTRQTTRRQGHRHHPVELLHSALTDMRSLIGWPSSSAGSGSGWAIVRLSARSCPVTVSAKSHRFCTYQCGSESGCLRSPAGSRCCPTGGPSASSPIPSAAAATERMANARPQGHASEVTRRPACHGKPARLT
jgi:hypothetical protein